MIFHHDLPIPFEDRWLVAAGAEGFVPSSSSYIVYATPGSAIISIDDIEPVRRVPLFKETHFTHDDGELTVDERVVRILRAFADGVALPPVQVVRSSSGAQPFELKDGVHRLYLSLVVGYTHVRAFEQPTFAWATNL